MSDRVPGAVTEVVVEVPVAAPPERVWAALTDWTRQGEWMLLTDVQVVEGDGAGVGTRVEARTGLPRVGPGGRHLGVLDRFTVTRWEPPHRVDVLHTGRVVRGPGIFEVRPRGEDATVVWTEQLDLPLGALGRLGWPLVRPAVVAGLEVSLRRFARYASRSS